jgi:recombination protein RecT
MTDQSLSAQIETAKAPPAQRSLAVELRHAEPAIAAALPEGFPGGPERFVRIVLTAVRLNPDLAKCTAISTIGAAMQAAQLGLTPGMLGEAWIIPYRSKTGTYEASFQIGWRGMVALAARARLRVTGAVVHEGDYFTWELGLEPSLVHRPVLERGKAIAWYAIVRDMDTGQLAGFAVLDRAMVEKRRKVSKAPNSPAWTEWYDEMALGKAAREALRFAPLTVEMGTAFASEEAVRTDLGGQAEDYAAPWQPGDEAEVVEG